MKKLILILLTIVAIEFNLQYYGNEHHPNWVKAWDSNGNEVELQETRERTNNVWYWNIFLNEKLLTFIEKLPLIENVSVEEQ